MLALLGLLTIVALFVVILTKRMSPLVALIAIPVIAALVGGFGLSTSKFIIGGIKDVAPVAGMFIFAILYFGIVTDAGMLDPIIDRILRENQIDGTRLLAFGDGYVEIQNTKEVGGLAVAVASDEANNGSGRMDEWKRQRLLGVGADVVIPDFRDAKQLLAVIFGEATR